MGRIEALLVKPVNHVLKATPWATERLRIHAGVHVGFGAGPFRCVMQIDAHGFLQASEIDETDVFIQFPDDFLVAAMVDRSRLMSSARISGTADVAETLAFVFRNLRWDVEGDLAGVLGDIPARRLTRMGSALFLSAQSAGERIVENLKEYAVEEAAVIVSTQEMQHFSSEVDVLRDDVARLEKRLQQLASRC